MSKIRVLPDVVASQVAAGEVVERPASVVKELVENSLDARARQIDVRADRGGVALIQVADDGCGMAREDALLSLERHATSKLREAADLAAIRTLGFRGEALPSIASVSRFRLATREHGALAGTEITIEGGRLIDVRDWGGAPGTVMEARQLFYNVPARRKFLRSENTEFGHIEQIVRVQALAHPEVGFTLSRDGRMLFQLAARASLRERITGLIGADGAAGLVEVPAGGRGGVRAHGWIAAPGNSRSDRSLSLVFINGRAVENPALTHALRAAYGDTLARGRHPLCFLFVEMDPAAVDVNVHPAKREVRFRDALGVQSALASLLRESLTASSAGRLGSTVPASPAPPVASTVPGAAFSAPASVEWMPRSERKPREGIYAFPGEELPAPAVARPARPVATQPALPLAPAAQKKYPPPQTEQPSEQSQPPAPATQTALAAAGPPPDMPAAAPAFRFMGLLAETCAVLESAEGLVLMDLRAAHERILYEQLRRRAAREESVPVQPLLVPVTLDLPPREAAVARDSLPLLRQIGFEVEEFGANTFKLEALPADLPVSDPAAWLAGLIEELGRSGEAAMRARIDFDSLAAKVSVLATPRAAARSRDEAESLLDRLLRCEMPYCDPVGRPTLVQFSHQELARKFGRKA